MERVLAEEDAQAASHSKQEIKKGTGSSVRLTFTVLSSPPPEGQRGRLFA